jgi:hypothetical protein
LPAACLPVKSSAGSQRHKLPKSDFTVRDNEIVIALIAALSINRDAPPRSRNILACRRRPGICLAVCRCARAVSFAVSLQEYKGKPHGTPTGASRNAGCKPGRKPTNQADMKDETRGLMKPFKTGQTEKSFSFLRPNFGIHRCTWLNTLKIQEIPRAGRGNGRLRFPRKRPRPYGSWIPADPARTGGPGGAARTLRQT